MGRKKAAGASTLVFCRCASCVRQLAQAKCRACESESDGEDLPGDSNFKVTRTEGGKLASRTYLQHAQYVQRAGAKKRDFGKKKDDRVRARRAARARACGAL